MHNQLETYMAEIEAHLAPLSSGQRVEELREMRAHLQAAIARQEDSQSHEEAVRDAIGQFGTPASVAGETVTAWRRGEALRKRGFWGAAACALTLTILLPRLFFPLERPHVLQAFQSHHLSPWVGVIVLLWQVPPFLLAGVVSGLAFSRRSVAGTGLAVAACEGFYLVRHIIRTPAIPPGFHLTAAAQLSFVSLLVGTLALNYGIYILAAVLGAWGAGRWRAIRTGRAAAAGM